MKKTRQRRILDATFWTVWALAGTVLVYQAAMAGERFSLATNDRWKAECGSCHVAYPPQLLPADGWRRVMGGLERHFGVDASVDAPAAAEIGAFLESHAASGKRARGAQGRMRITETAWFTRKHDEVPTAAWKNRADCAACHRGAEQGDFRERDVRIPR